MRTPVGVGPTRLGGPRARLPRHSAPRAVFNRNHQMRATAPSKRVPAQRSPTTAPPHDTERTGGLMVRPWPSKPMIRVRFPAGALPSVVRQPTFTSRCSVNSRLVHFSSTLRARSDSDARADREECRNGNRSLPVAHSERRESTSGFGSISARGTLVAPQPTFTSRCSVNSRLVHSYAARKRAAFATPRRRGFVGWSGRRSVRRRRRAEGRRRSVRSGASSPGSPARPIRARPSRGTCPCGT